MLLRGITDVRAGQLSAGSFYVSGADGLFAVDSLGVIAKVLDRPALTLRRWAGGVLAYSDTAIILIGDAESDPMEVSEPPLPSGAPDWRYLAVQSLSRSSRDTVWALVGVHPEEKRYEIQRVFSAIHTEGEWTVGEVALDQPSWSTGSPFSFARVLPGMFYDLDYFCPDPPRELTYDADCAEENASTLVTQLTPDGDISTTVHPHYLPSIQMSNDGQLYAALNARSIVRLSNSFSEADTVFRLMPPELIEEGDPSISHFFFFEDGGGLVVIDQQFLVEPE